jgi:hypothetical protein
LSRSAKISPSEQRKELQAQLKALTANGKGNEKAASISTSGTGWASVVHLPAGSVDAATMKQLRSLFTPLGSGAYGLQSALVSVRIGSDGSVSAGSVGLNSLG